MKKFLHILVLFISVLTLFSCSKEDNNPVTPETMTVTDIDGNKYQAVKIGNQWWLAENLKVTHYSNGDPIPKVTDNDAWKNLSTGAYCHYNNDLNLGNTYGNLYNWHALNDSRKIAPQGWHIPSNAEWRALFDFLGGIEVAGGKMKKNENWDSPNAGATNTSGFSAIPGSGRSKDGSYHDMGRFALFWSSNEYGSGFNDAWFWELNSNSSGALLHLDNKRYGFSVRCIKD